jgi:transposase
VEPWGEWVIARWNAGHHNGRQMLRERGFRGNYATVLRYLNRLRAAQGNARPHRSRARPGPPLVAAPKRVLTPRTAAWLVLRRPEHRDAEDQALLAGLREHSCVLDVAIELAEGLRQLKPGGTLLLKF